MVRGARVAEPNGRGDTLAVEAIGIPKTFVLPHEQRSTLKEHFLHPLRRTMFERQAAVVDVSFEVPHGEMFGIIGLNGSGKSTLLKIIAGIYRQDTGTVRLNGKLSPFIELGGGFNPDLTGRDNIRINSTLLKILAGIYRADTGSVRINGALSPFIELGVGFNPELNARDNVRINATLLGLTRRQLAQRFDDIIEFADLGRFVDQKLKNYSSGMQVRLAYSIAIQVPFDILLLDEVLAVGDQDFQEKCFDTFKDFRAQGKTIVFVSHDLASVERFCDRALYLQHGRVQMIGETNDVIERYLQNEVGQANPLVPASG